MFEKVNDIDEVALSVLKKRYFKEGETTWEQVADRILNHVFRNGGVSTMMRNLLVNRYFIPNSPCIVNSGSNNGGLIACFVVPFEDSILDIYKTKLDFALIAKKGGGCGTTLSNIRPEKEIVEGSAHGYAGGPIKFFDTITHDMEAMTQAGFREMAMMGTMSVYHPDIMKFITCKETEGKLRLSNLSVVVDDAFMELVKTDGTYWTYFDYPSGRKLYQELKAKDVFNAIVEGAWKNGEPGLLFYDRINNSPYKYSGQIIEATNPCGEQPLPPYGSCNLGSIDVSKLVLELSTGPYFDWNAFRFAVKLGVDFLDRVLDVNKFPTPEIEEWAKDNRPVGLGVMGLADLFMKLHIAYGSKESLELTESLFKFMKVEAEQESERLGSLYGVPRACSYLPVPRRNITCLTVAPTGSIAILAGCNSGIEPIFSEVTKREDKTGKYIIKHPEHDQEYFRCAVSSNGSVEVTWQEHILIQDAVQKYVDSGVSKTCNFPNHTRRETIAHSYMYAWELGSIKGLTVYRNGSRDVEVLSPKNIKKDKCPVCDSDLIQESGCKKCSDPMCGWTVCEVA